MIADSEVTQSHDVETVLIGSYKRRVSIKRIKDVDVFCRMEEPGGITAKEALDKFEAALRSSYGGERIRRQNRSLQVDFPSYDLFVDVVPARPSGTHWEIPERSEGENEWVETDPEQLTTLTSNRNSQFKLGDSGIYVPTVKLMRQLRRAHLRKHPSGLYVEVLTYWAFGHGVTGSSVAEYLTNALQRAAVRMHTALSEGLPDPTLDGKKIDTKASADDLKHTATTLDQLTESARRALADEDECRSALIWRDLLGTNEAGEVFPMPDFCNPDGTRKTTGATARAGERLVPAGEGRFAR